MAPPKIFAALAVAVLSICGANAGPCRPLTTTTVATSTTAAATTSTAAPTSTAPACSNDQILNDPSFEDNGGSPWSISGSYGQGNAHTGLAEVVITGHGGGASGTIAQTLSHIEPGLYQLSFAYTVKNLTPSVGTDGGFSCTYQASIGGQLVLVDSADESGPWYSDWSIASGYWATAGVDNAVVEIDVQCGGEFDDIVLLTDDVKLTRQCETSG
ncbi:hypothetical protein BGZ63DRAFT_103742 [Mariannaea sp. PMI_226]|nr:hypothetical protein BGZ63DRAFT_103742 [Mariannaea sp. PMI_226]